MDSSKLCFRLNKIFPNVLSYYWVMVDISNKKYKAIYKSNNCKKIIETSYWKNKDIYMYFLKNQDGSDKEKTSVKPSDLSNYIVRYVKSIFDDYRMSLERIQTAIKEYNDNENILSYKKDSVSINTELAKNELY